MRDLSLFGILPPRDVETERRMEASDSPMSSPSALPLLPCHALSILTAVPVSGTGQDKNTGMAMEIAGVAHVMRMELRRASQQ